MTSTIHMPRSVLDFLAEKPLVNAIGARTQWGGRAPSPATLEVMRRAAGLYMNVPAVLQAAGEEVAALTRNEAGVVCTSASGGLYLAVMGAIAAADPTLLHGTGKARGQVHVGVHRLHRSPTDRTVGASGAIFLEFGTQLEVRIEELRAIVGSCVAVVYNAGGFYERAALPLSQVISVCDAAGVPVIVNAAGQLPAVSNLWCYTLEMGAAAAIFSGGKDLAGPQGSAFIVGRRPFMEHVAAAAYPNFSGSRGMKMGKEAALGLVAALREYLGIDHDKRRAKARDTVEQWKSRVEGFGARAWIDHEDYFPQLVIAFDDPAAGQRLHATLLADRIAAGLIGSSGWVVLCAQCVDDHEADFVATRLLDAVRCA